MKDKYDRPIDYIRISLTDRCNLRCIYCMPEDGVDLVRHEDILSYEELIRLCKALIKIGINNFKLTGGEPLVRLNITDFIGQLKSLEGVGEVTITTNGVLLEDMGLDLMESGIDRINVSLDTLDPDKFHALTRGGDLNKVLRGIDLITGQGFDKLKINAVPIKPIDAKDLADLIRLGEDRPIDIRFINLMPIGQGDEGSGYSKDEMKEIIDRAYGKGQIYLGKRGNGPAQYYSYPGLKGKIGFIDAIDDKFCHKCNRIRLSATGFLKLCLHYNVGENIRNLINDNSIEDLAIELERIIYNKPLMHQMGQSDSKFTESRNMNQIGG